MIFLQANISSAVSKLSSITECGEKSSIFLEDVEDGAVTGQQSCTGLNSYLNLTLLQHKDDISLCYPHHFPGSVVELLTNFQLLKSNKVSDCFNTNAR